MGLRFRRSFGLLPGVRINLNLRGLSASIGKPGARVTIGTAGTRANVGLPGSGVSYSERLGRPVFWLLLGVCVLVWIFT